MADENQVKILLSGTDAWNDWREHNPNVGIDLNGAILNNADLRRANLSGASLIDAKIREAVLLGADLSHCDLTGADLYCSFLLEADLTGSHLCSANLYAAYLRHAKLDGADLSGANLQSTVLLETSIEGTTLRNLKIYGISAWDLNGKPKDQSNLIITRDGQPTITVDDLQVAQFIYLLLNRENIRNVLETITSKAVLILGRFTPERKFILDAIAEELRKHDLLPIIFDFERAKSRDYTETIKILAGLSLFVIADITEPRSIPLELLAIIPDYKIPFVPIIQTAEEQFSLFNDLRKYNWVLNPVEYSSLKVLQDAFKDLIIDRAIERHRVLQAEKAIKLQTLSAEEYLKKKNNLST